MMPTISIIVPCYNVSAYMQRCLDSLINQTFKDIEIICINDGSTDNTGQIIKEYTQKDSRIIYIDHSNSGPASSRNAGLRKASGDYVMFCDSDDWYEKNMCAHMYNTIKKQEVDLVICDSSLHYENNYKRSGKTPTYTKLKLKGKGQLNYSNYKSVNVLLWNKIFRKKIIDEYSITFPDGYEHDDDAFVLQYALISKTYFGLEEQLYNYSIRENSIMDIFTKRTNQEKDLDVIHAYYHVYKFLIKNNLWENHKIFFSYLMGDMIRYCYCRIDNNNRNSMIELCSSLFKDTDTNGLKSKKSKFFIAICQSDIKKMQQYLWCKEKKRKLWGLTIIKCRTNNSYKRYTILNLLSFSLTHNQHLN